VTIVSNRKKEVLVVEDHDHLRGMFSTILTIAGFKTYEARNGFEALLIMDTRKLDLVTLDLGLPGMDGFAIQREIAANAFLRHIPVVVITGSEDDLSHLDVACILRKPVTAERLLTSVQECLAAGVPFSGV